MKLAPRDTWPYVRVTLLPLPWTWRLVPRPYADDVDGPLALSSFEWLFLHVEWMGQKGGWLNQFFER